MVPELRGEDANEAELNLRPLAASDRGSFTHAPPPELHLVGAFYASVEQLLDLASAASRLRSAATAFSRPPMKRGPPASEAACLDGAHGNSVPTSCLADISTNTNGSATPPSEY